MPGAQIDETMVMAPETERYRVPAEPLRLSGPVTRPAPGTLPLRGDLAHIALATRYLVQNYVKPLIQEVGPEGAVLRLHPTAGAEPVTHLPGASHVELLDQVGSWAWVCRGPDGPTGFVPLAELASAR